MGVVPMEVESSFYSRGYAYVTRAVYVYCDQCGSFNVRKHLSYRQVLLLLGALLAAAVAALLASEPISTGTRFSVTCGGPLLVLAVAGAIVAGYWGRPGYSCRHCGGQATTRYNTLSYPSDPS
ncbi:MAG TPA: hypothetical protein VLC95_09550, partial [Anaerolineae bacterium]|nr:hypothetical protein [Anaerolineae bacterium]